MRFRNIVPLLAFALASACRDSTAPVDPIMEVHLSPFQQEEITTSVFSFQENEMIFTAPVGVDPVVDLSWDKVGTSSPDLKVFEPEMIRDPEHICQSSCTKVTWRYRVQFYARDFGEAVFTATLRLNPSEKSVFKVIARR
ncbi:hypothetical protein KW796_01920 [Candidatus Parcubacteria bacterium]|nr:hypothetical protein [Candidatus Parcubacteria bacterium]